MELQTNTKDSNKLLKVLRVVAAIGLIGYFSFIGAWFPLADRIDYVFLVSYYFITGFIVGLFIQKWWIPVFIAAPNVAIALMAYGLEFVVANVVIPVSMTLLGGVASINLLNKIRSITSN